MGDASSRLAAGFVLPKAKLLKLLGVRFMHLIFIILLVISILFLTVGVISPLKDKKNPDKTIPRKQAALIFGLLIVLFGILTAVTAPKPVMSVPKKPVKSVAKVATKPATKPTVALATLNAQAVPILTAATSHYEQQMNTVQSEAGASDAANSNSAFTTQWRTFQTKDDSTGNSADTQVLNLYYNGKQTAPGALDNWSTDIEAVNSDIVTWTNDQETVNADQATGNDATSDQAKVTADNQKYQSDLAKAKTDIGQF